MDGDGPVPPLRASGLVPSHRFSNFSESPAARPGHSDGPELARRRHTDGGAVGSSRLTAASGGAVGKAEEERVGRDKKSQEADRELDDAAANLKGEDVFMYGAARALTKLGYNNRRGKGNGKGLQEGDFLSFAVAAVSETWAHDKPPSSPTPSTSSIG